MLIAERNRQAVPRVDQPDERRQVGYFGVGKFVAQGIEQRILGDYVWRLGNGAGFGRLHDHIVILAVTARAEHDHAIEIS